MQKWRYLRFEKDTRFYELRLELDLLGHWVISAINGRKGSRLGKMVIHYYETKFEADIEFVKMMNYRVNRRKYKLQRGTNSYN
jgi:hypothetical protein